jgi:hypothetical protein
MFPHHNPVYSSSLPICATCLAHLIILNLITRKKIGKKERSLGSSFCNFLQSSVTSSLLDPNILVSTLFSDILSLRSSLNVSDQVSYPYKTTVKIIVLYILIFGAWGSVVVKALRYKSDGPGIDSRWCHWIFQ